CHQLREALVRAKQQPTQIILLMGGSDFWSNGIHLNQIEAAQSTADESWNNINAMDDLALEIINTENQIVISALQGNAGAGGVFLARAADEVWARQGIILNPHYKDMGNLYGSEYWTYLLPRHCGEENVERITQARLPMGTHEALQLGLVNHVIDHPRESFTEAVQQRCSSYLDSDIAQRL
ncbi:MAG: enoyl-CoA hydratase/isomerase family protein, partial [Gammaproteobacteria bacterium]|nr:enoyl-CoA hydratase/isomerase family protein [Gammaproteobacteria bacterium]